MFFHHKNNKINTAHSAHNKIEENFSNFKVNGKSISLCNHFSGKQKGKEKNRRRAKQQKRIP